MRTKELYEIVDNNSLLKKLYKLVLANKSKISCGLCAYNKGENLKRRDSKCWKRYRKTQYRIK